MEMAIGVLAILAIIYAAILQEKLRRLRGDTEGQIIITEDEETGKRTFTLELDKDPYEMSKMGYITFKVTDQASEDLD